MTSTSQMTDDLIAPCSECYRTPTTHASFEWLTGLGIVHRHSTRSGRFCRDCGLSIARTTVLHNIRGGWWSPVALLLNPLVLWRNHRTSRRVANTPASSMPRTKLTLDPGRPFFLRFGVVLPVAMISVALGLGAYFREQAGAGDIEVGMCFDLPDRELSVSVSLQACDDPHDAQVTSLIDLGELSELHDNARAGLPPSEDPAARMIGEDPLYEAVLGTLTNEECARDAAKILPEAAADSTNVGHLEEVMTNGDTTFGFGSGVICYVTSLDGSPLDRSLLDD